MYVILLVPLSFVISGFILKKCAHEEPNPSVGYRTTLSGKNQDTWTVANAYSANWFLFGGSILTALTIISLMLPDIGMIEILMCFGVSLAYALVVIGVTERHLNKLFDKDGNRKTTNSN